MNKHELVEAISKETKFLKSDTERFLNTFVDTVTKNMKKDKDGVKIVGFGTWKAVKRKSRIGRNPQTGQQISIPARTVPVFRAGQELKNSILKSK